MPNHRLVLHLSLISFLVCATSASGQVIHESAKFLADDAVSRDRLGKAIAIDGDTIAVSALSDFLNLSTGAVYLFDQSTGEQYAKLESDTPANEDRFGEAVALNEGVVAVSASYDSDNGTTAGAVYLFDAITGTRLNKIYPLDAEAGHWFGWSLAADGGVLSVGAVGDDTNGSFSGAVYLFDLHTGEQLHKLVSNEGEPFDQLGYSVAIDNNLVLAGAPSSPHETPTQSGAAHLFDATTGNQIRTFVPSDPNEYGWFGSSVALDGSTFAIGAQHDGLPELNSGSAYIFSLHAQEPLHKLSPTYPEREQLFGWSIALQDGVVAVGAPWTGLSGATYLFDVSTGEQIAELLPRAEVDGGCQGSSVSMCGETIAVGAPHNSGTALSAGAVFLYSFPESGCIADTNRNASLDPGDFNTWIAAFNRGAPACDQNEDDLCTPSDFNAWIANYNAGCD